MWGGRRRGLLAILATVGLAGSTLAWLGLGRAQPPPVCAPDATTTVCLLPASQSVTAGGSFSTDIVIDDVANLGAYQITVAFDPAIVRFTSATYGPFLGSTGRVTNCFTPSISSGRVRFACVTTAPTDVGPPGPPGPSGSGLLAKANFSALAPGSSLLDLVDVIVTDVAGSVIPHLEQDAQVTVQPAFTPTPCPGGICPTATPTPTRTPTPTPGTGPTTVRVDPAAQNQLTGSFFPVNIVVDGVSNLGAYEFTLAWDAKVLSFVSVSNGTLLGSTERSPFCPPASLGTNTVRFGCVTTGSSPPGPDGSGVLAQLVFLAVGASDGLPSPLDLFNVSLSSPLGTGITTLVVDGTVTVSEAPTPTPTPCPGGVCPTPTNTPVPTSTPTPTPTPLPAPCAPGVGTRVCVQPPDQFVSAGFNFNVDVTVDSVTNLGAYEFTLAFDPAVVAFSGFTNGPFLGGTGRTVSCLTPSLAISSVRISCVTLGPTPAGPNGSGVLATVTFLGVSGGVSTLDLQGVKLTDVVGTLIPASDQDGSVTVITGPTPTPTITPTPGPTFTPTITPTPTPPPSTITRVSPATQTVASGGTFTVDITIEGVANLASYEWRLAFDPALVSFVSVVNGPFLGSTGRSVFCPPPILDTLAGTVRFGCATTGTTPPGPTGAGVLSTLTLSALAPGASALDLVFVSLSDPLALDIPTQVFDGDVTISPPATPTPTATLTPTATPLVQSAPWSDARPPLLDAASRRETAA